jgi:putative membrane protein
VHGERADVLAWVRTSINHGLRFRGRKVFALRETDGILPGKEVSPPPPGYSSIIGIVLVGLGVVMSVIAFVRYKTVERQIDEDAYRSSAILSVLLTLAMIAIGVFLMLYLVHSM